MNQLRAIFVLSEQAFTDCYGQQIDAISKLVDVVASPQTAATMSTRPELWGQVDVLFSGWQPPRLTREVLEYAPRLRAVFMAAGSVARLMTSDAWRRPLTVVSASAVNAMPVAEFTVAAITLSLKQVWRLSRLMTERHEYPDFDHVLGCCGPTVGLISLGAVGRAVAQRLRAFDLAVIAYDPYVSAQEAATLGVRLVSLGDLFERADVISVHTPLCPETVGLITHEHLSRMRPWSTLINTARGQIINESDLVSVATSRQDLQFVLDVTERLPPEPDSPLYCLPNVMLTPHIAGSMGAERRRLGLYVAEELQRYVNGEPLRSRITEATALTSSHWSES
jgi:phosphoglycerate dehydrogenase-like enzyme